MSGVIRWEEPPPEEPPKFPGRGGPIADWWRVASQLRDRPGQWAAVAEGCTNQQATLIRQGTLNAFKPAGSFDATARRVNGIYTVYARYVGTGDRA